MVKTYIINNIKHTIKSWSRIALLQFAIGWSICANASTVQSNWQDTTKREVAQSAIYWQTKTINNYNLLDAKGLKGPMFSKPFGNRSLENRVNHYFGSPSIVSAAPNIFSASALLKDSIRTRIELFGGTQNRKGGYFYSQQAAERITFQLWGAVDAGENFAFNDVYPSILPIVNTITQGGVMDNLINTQVEGDLMQSDEAEDLLYFEDWRIGGSISNSNTQAWQLALAASYDKSKGLSYDPFGTRYEQKQATNVQLKAAKDHFSFLTNYQNVQSGKDNKPSYLLATGYNMPINTQQWDVELNYQQEIEQWKNSLVQFSTNHIYQQYQTQHQVFGRNETTDDYRIHSVSTGIDIPVSSVIKASAKVDYLYFQPVKRGGVAYDVQLDYEFSKKHQLGFRAQRNARIPNSFELFADFPISTTEYYDIWLTGNASAKSPDNLPLIDWRFSEFDETPLQAGFSLNRAYINWNETGKEALSAYFEENPPNLPSFEILQSILTEEFAPNGFFNEFILTDVFTQRPSDLITADKAKITYENLYAVDYKGQISDRLDLILSAFYVHQQHPTQLNILTPTVSFLPGLGKAFGQTVQDRIQEPYEEFLINVGFLDPEFSAQNAAEIGQIINQVYGQVAEDFLANELMNGPTFYGIVQNNQTPSNNIPTVMAGYPTFDAIRYWGVEGGFNFVVKSNLTINGRFRYLNKNVFDEVTINHSETPLVYSLNQPNQLLEMGISYQGKSISGTLSYQFENAYWAQYGFFSGEIGHKHLVNMGVEYRINRSLTIGAKGLNILNFTYSSLVGLPLIDRQLLLNISYNFN